MYNRRVFSSCKWPVREVMWFSHVQRFLHDYHESNGANINGWNKIDSLLFFRLNINL